MPPELLVGVVDVHRDWMIKTSDIDSTDRVGLGLEAVCSTHPMPAVEDIMAKRRGNYVQMPAETSKQAYSSLVKRTSLSV